LSGSPFSSHSTQTQSPADPARALSAAGTIVTPHVGQIGGCSSSTPRVWSGRRSGGSHGQRSGTTNRFPWRASALRVPGRWAERRAKLYERLRQPPSASTVADSLPVLFFGDLFTAEVATVGLNPSDQEYLTGGGQPLVGPAQRFATLASVGVIDRASLTDEQCANAIEWMRAYYDAGKPVFGAWFNGLKRVVAGFGASFEDRSAVHLDLIQESTGPVRSKLEPPERDPLLARDLPFFVWEIRSFPITAVICTGKTVSVNVRRELGVEVEEEGTKARIRWWVGHAVIEGREVGFAGWNYPLDRPTGLGREGESELGQLLAERLRWRPSSGSGGTAGTTEAVG
jgi:uracil-DNA glycosylase